MPIVIFFLIGSWGLNFEGVFSVILVISVIKFIQVSENYQLSLVN